MRFDVVTLMPELVMPVVGQGVTGRAHDRGLIDLQTWNPRDYTTDVHRAVDDRPYGGGPGMVMKVDPLMQAVRAAKAAAGAGARALYMSPQGRPLTQQGAQELAENDSLILVCGRYEGVDERFIETEIDEEWSIGDYVLSGGELAATVIIDAVSRLLPGVLGDAQSAEQDSYMDGLLDCPHYTRPEIINGMGVPDVLRSGNHDAIRQWRAKQALGRTWLRRPDLLARLELNEEQQALLAEFQAEHRQ